MHKSDERRVIRFYGVAKAKNNFAKMLKEAQAGAVIITNHGRPAMIIGIEGVSIEGAVIDQMISEIRALIETRKAK
jgi:prevent-host-death family protein